MSKEKDHSTITIDEAIAWVNANCRFEHNRKRIRSRAVAWLLFTHLENVVRESIVLVHQNKAFRTELDSLQEQINSMRDAKQLDKLEV